MTALDILVLIAVFGAAIPGFMRGFVTEVLALFAAAGRATGEIGNRHEIDDMAELSRNQSPLVAY